MIYVSNGEISMALFSLDFLNKYMGQDRKRGAGKQKDNHRERPVWIFQRQACSLVRFGAFDRTGGFLILQFCDFTFVLNRIVHLPIPSENVSRRGKKFRNAK